MEVLVAVDGQDKPIAMLALSHRPQLRLRGRLVSIDELVVSPLWRRRGVGRALVSCAVARARALKAERVDLLAEGGEDEGTAAFAHACGFCEAPTRIAWMRAAELKSRT